ncbi:MAG: hypothetical protein NTV46_00340 [Verrucomicrobia bacterium]|nr:hypothetical protein [Verrucomicrobiota bacterium]
MNENIPVPPVPPSNPAVKKGMPTLAWVGIGCGTVIVIAVVVVAMLVGWCKRSVGDLSEFKNNPEKAAAEMMVRLNPEIKLVSQDDAKGEMTIRTKDGQEMTMSYKDVGEGKITMKDAQGNVSQIGKSDLSNVPAWVPRVPKMKSATGSFQNKEDEKITGLYSATSDESISKLDEFFKTEAGKLKMTEASRTSMNTDGVENLITAYEGEGGRMLNVIITGKPGEAAQVNVGYEEAK